MVSLPIIHNIGIALYMGIDTYNSNKNDLTCIYYIT